MEPQSLKPRSGYHTEFKGLIARIVDWVVLGARKKMYSVFSQRFLDIHSIVDIGVTSEGVAAPANFMEKWFPDKNKITAVGIEDASHLETQFPGLKFVQVEAGKPLPFKNGQFSVAFSNAVIEHVVDDKDRLQFVKEMSRVSERIFLTTPNKYFPIEPHTGIPFLHFLAPKTFNKWLDQGKISKFYSTKNLRLLDLNELKRVVKLAGLKGEIHKIRTFGFVSNFIFVSHPTTPANNPHNSNSYTYPPA